MEESSFQAIYTGVYIVVFIAALTTALYLFNGITELAENTYEYGKVVTGQTVIEGTDVDELSYTDSDIISYYMNYVKKDKFENGSEPDNIASVSFNIGTTINSNLSYKQLLAKIRNKEYILVTTNVEDAFEIRKK